MDDPNPDRIADLVVSLKTASHENSRAWLQLRTEEAMHQAAHDRAVRTHKDTTEGFCRISTSICHLGVLVSRLEREADAVREALEAFGRALENPPEPPQADLPLEG